MNDPAIANLIHLLNTKLSIMNIQIVMKHELLTLDITLVPSEMSGTDKQFGGTGKY